MVGTRSNVVRSVLGRSLAGADRSDAGIIEGCWGELDEREPGCDFDGFRMYVRIYGLFRAPGTDPGLC